MSDQRADNQKIVSLHMDEELVRNLDQAVIQTGLPTRSHFIRVAIKEKLEREGMSIPIEQIAPGSRIDPTGKPVAPISYPVIQPSPQLLNEGASAGLRRVVDRLDDEDVKTMRKAVDLFESILAGKGDATPAAAAEEVTKSRPERKKGSRNKS